MFKDHSQITTNKIFVYELSTPDCSLYRVVISHHHSAINIDFDTIDFHSIKSLLAENTAKSIRNKKGVTYNNIINIWQEVIEEYWATK